MKKGESGADMYLRQYDQTVDSYRGSHNPQMILAVEEYDKAKKNYLNARTQKGSLFSDTSDQKALERSAQSLLSAKESVETVAKKHNIQPEPPTSWNQSSKAR